MLGEGTKSTPKIFANILISFIGAGILGVPYAFKEAGIIEGALVLAFVGFLSRLLTQDIKQVNKLPHHSSSEGVFILSMKGGYERLVSLNGENTKQSDLDRDLHVETKEPLKLVVHHELEFGDVGQHAFGKSGIVLVDSLVILSQVGFCCAYLIFISENLSIFLHRDKHLFLWLLVIPLIVLINVRQLHHLSIFSLFADFANLFAYCVVFWFDFENYHTVGKEVHSFSIQGLPFMIGISVYCYEGAGMILSLESSVAKECRDKFYGIFKLAMFVITCLYLTFGICGYLSFGEETKNIITLNLPSGVFPALVNCCLMFSLFFTYPIMMFPVSRILDMRLFRNPKTEDYYKSSVVRSSLVLITALVVIGIPNFSTLMALIGSTCCILLGLILPGIFHLRIFAGKITIYEKVLDYLIITLGLVGSFLGTKDAVTRLVSQWQN